jgi:hypothetical protein
MTNQPAYYECHCGFYHPLGYDGGCEVADARFISEELDEIHGEGQWQEVFVDQEGEVSAPPAPSPVRRHKNYDRMMALTEDTDINGNKLVPGCRVRCYSLAAYNADNDWFTGMEIADRESEGHFSYLEGELVAIDEYFANDPVRKGRYYQVAMTKSVAPVVVRSHNTFEMTERIETRHYSDGRAFPIYWPVNGEDRECGKSFSTVRI